MWRDPQVVAAYAREDAIVDKVRRQLSRVGGRQTSSLEMRCTGVGGRDLEPVARQNLGDASIGCGERLGNRSNTPFLKHSQCGQRTGDV